MPSADTDMVSEVAVEEGGVVEVEALVTVVVLERTVVEAGVVVVVVVEVWGRLGT